MTENTPLWRVALPLRAQLGEGLHWDARRQHLWMVDIHGRKVMRWALDAEHVDTWSLPQRVGWVLPEPDRETVLLGLQEGIARTVLEADVATPKLQWIVRPFDGRPYMRLNDAKRDAHGRIWFGSLNNDDESRANGSLFRLDPDGAWCEVDQGYTVANGPALSPDGRTLLHTDSGRRIIYAFDLDPVSGSLTNKRCWKTFIDSEGYPDGMCFDAQGCIWVAHWGGSCISRFEPTGRLLKRVALPASQITNVCFAGPRLDRLFVATAAVGLDTERGSVSGHLLEVLDMQGVTGLLTTFQLG